MASAALNVLEETKLILEWAADNYKGKLVEGEGRVRRVGAPGLAALALASALGAMSVRSCCARQRCLASPGHILSSAVYLTPSFAPTHPLP